MTPSDKARGRLRVEHWRQRNRDTGLCACGNPRRPGLTKHGRPSKICEVCTDRNTRDAAGGALGPRPARMRVTLSIDVRPDLLAQWLEFSEAQATPVPELVEAAMELLVAVTQQAESAEQQARDEEEVQRWLASA